jgi:hypothetical protein
VGFNRNIPDGRRHPNAITGSCLEKLHDLFSLQFMLMQLVPQSAIYRAKWAKSFQMRELSAEGILIALNSFPDAIKFQHVSQSSSQPLNSGSPIKVCVPDVFFFFPSSPSDGPSKISTVTVFCFQAENVQKRISLHGPTSISFYLTGQCCEVRHAYFFSMNFCMQY